jgi:hypothetical protein
MEGSAETRVITVTISLSDLEAAALYAELYRIAADGRQPAQYAAGSSIAGLMGVLAGLGLDS